MSSFVPPGWPTGVQPPGSPDFEGSAVTWLLGVIPSDYVLHGVLRRHPIALATLAKHHLNACVEGARNGYRTARSELGPNLPPSAVEAVLVAYRSEGVRLAATARAADLVDRALHGEQFVRQMSGGARSSAQGQRNSPVARGSNRPGAPGRVRSRDRPLPAPRQPAPAEPLERSPERARAGTRRAGGRSPRHRERQYRLAATLRPASSSHCPG